MVDLTVGEAIVGATNVNCGGVADLALQCTRRGLVLIDVVRRNGKVRLLGAASRRFAGQRVKIRFMATGKIVARPRVSQLGPVPRHREAAPREAAQQQPRPLPARRSASRRACGSSSCGGLLVSSTNTRRGKVTISGRVVRPLASPCSRSSSSGGCRAGATRSSSASSRARTAASGSPSAGPAEDQAAAYRLQTRVRKFTTNPKTFPTFTLPRYVDLG